VEVPGKEEYLSGGAKSPKRRRVRGKLGCEEVITVLGEEKDGAGRVRGGLNENYSRLDSDGNRKKDDRTR